MRQQVTVFGANGKVGSLVVVELLKRDYDVVAFVHNKSHLPDSPHLKLFRGDIYNANSVDEALVGSSIVVSALGSWGTPKKDILTVGMSNIIPSMQRRGISRIVSLTGAEARASGDHLGVIHRLMHLLLGIVAGKVLADGERHVTQLENSQLDWTVIRSPIMAPNTSKELTAYRLTMKRPMPWVIINRRRVVLSIVDAVDNQDWNRQAPFVS